jgi:hypothetical protein
MSRALTLLALAACGDLKGFSGPVPPLATYTVEVTGTPATPPHHLQIALVWGMQWLPEQLCVVPAQDAEVQLVLDDGCRDPFGFVPLRVETNLEVTPGVPVTVELQSLPGADVLVGDLTARVAYGSIVVYDDRDDSGRLELARPNRLGVPTEGPGSDTSPTMLSDVVLGASFVTMTAPDQRIAYREGAFSAAAAFYPRQGCGDPPPGFSVLAASGFSAADALAAAIQGMLPDERDVSQCAQAAPADVTITVPITAPGADAELACTERTADSSVRFLEPPVDKPDFSSRAIACAGWPPGPPGTSSLTELIVSGRTDGKDACKGISHFVLKGCRESPTCGTPDWDHSLAPPTWWPCAVP